MKLIGSILKKIKLGSRKRNALRPTRLINPVREWALGLGISTLLFLALSGYFGYDFYTQYNRGDTGAPLDGSITTYREKDVQSVLEVYRARQDQFELLRKDRSAIVVPVLPPAEAPSTSSQENEESVTPLAV